MQTLQRLIFCACVCRCMFEHVLVWVSVQSLSVKKTDGLWKKLLHSLEARARMLQNLQMSGGWKVFRRAEWGHPQCYWLCGCSNGVDVCDRGNIDSNYLLRCSNYVLIHILGSCDPMQCRFHTRQWLSCSGCFQLYLCIMWWEGDGSWAFLSQCRK